MHDVGFWTSPGCATWLTFHRCRDLAAGSQRGETKSIGASAGTFLNRSDAFNSLSSGRPSRSGWQALVPWNSKLSSSVGA